MGWWVKLVVDTAKTTLPFQHELRRLKRRLSPYRTNPANDRLALAQGLRQISILRQTGSWTHDIRVLEIGSGWTPIIPLLFVAAGARQVILTDIERLLDRHTLLNALDVILAGADEVARVLNMDPDRLRLILDADRSLGLDDLLRHFGLVYQVPHDVSAIADGSLDLVCSRAVLEHIPPAELARLVRAYGSKLSPGGLMCHVVDNSDHWEHRDKSISRVNFLRYGETAWRLTGINPQNYQNRLRHPDYVELLQECGLRVLIAEGDVDARSLADLRTMRVHRRFAHRSLEELATLTSYLVAEKEA